MDMFSFLNSVFVIIDHKIKIQPYIANKILNMKKKKMIKADVNTLFTH